VGGCFGGGDGQGSGTSADGGAAPGTTEPHATGGSGNAGTGAQAGGSGGTGAITGGAGGASGTGGAGGGGPVEVGEITKVDFLLVVDNSGSMREEQAALTAQFPALVRALSTGDVDDDGTADYPAVKDLHLGVVSSDMGLVGIQGIPGCDGLGDDGIMNNVPNASVAGCQATYPRFLTYLPSVNDPDQTATDFACLATLGTDGCGFEQQLEAGLKALWPSVDVDPDGNVIEPNRILFLGDAMGFGQLGHGDTDNKDFLRNDPRIGLSLIAAVFVTDEEDCSSADTGHFTPELYLDPNDPEDAKLLMQDLNLRCVNNQQNLYSVERYVAGLQALRPGAEQLVLFGVIAGVPPDLVDDAARAGVDFADEASRNAYYDGILDDARMQHEPDPAKPPGEGNLIPSCETTSGIAYPPRRFVETARLFGEEAIVQSICQEDFTAPVRAIVERIGERLAEPVRGR
jgi:hypothetical protein